MSDLGHRTRSVILLAVSVLVLSHDAFAGICCEGIQNPNDCPHKNPSTCFIAGSIGECGAKCLGIVHKNKNCKNTICQGIQQRGEGCRGTATTTPVTALPAMRILTLTSATCEVTGGFKLGVIEIPLVATTMDCTGTVTLLIAATSDPNTHRVTVTDLSGFSTPSFNLGGFQIQTQSMSVLSQGLTLSLPDNILSGKMQILTRTNLGDVLEDMDVYGTFDLATGQATVDTFAELVEPPDHGVPLASATVIALMVASLLAIGGWYLSRQIQVRGATG